MPPASRPAAPYAITVFTDSADYVPNAAITATIRVARVAPGSARVSIDRFRNLHWQVKLMGGDGQPVALTDAGRSKLGRGIGSRVLGTWEQGDGEEWSLSLNSLFDIREQGTYILHVTKQVIASDGEYSIEDRCVFYVGERPSR